MKIILCIALIIGATITLKAQDNEKVVEKDELVKKYKIDGKVKEEGPIDADGKRKGLWKKYNTKDGSLKETIDFSTMTKKFIRKGQVTGMGKVKNDGYEKTGVWRYYHENGALKAMGQENGQFIDDKNRKGQWKEFYDNGNLAAIKIYTEAGIPIGVWNIYYQNGEIKTIITYEEGENILIKQYSENGDILLIQERINGSEWEVCEFHSNGKIKSKVSFKNGGLYNILSLKDKNGNDLDFGTLKNGNGIIKSYSDEGTLESNKTIENGIYNGLMEAYYSTNIDGLQLNYKTTGHFKNGDRDGIFKTVVTKDGKTTTFRINKYLNGIEIEEKVYDLEGILRLEFTIDLEKYSKEEINYYPSGAIKTKLQYQIPDTLLNVIICKDPNGKDLDYGSLKDGTGTYKQYDGDGKLKATYTFEYGTIVAKE